MVEWQVARRRVALNPPTHGRRGRQSTYTPRQEAFRSSVGAGGLIEANFDAEKEVHHVCFGTYQAKITWATSFQAPEAGAAGHAFALTPSGRRPPRWEGTLRVRAWWRARLAPSSKCVLERDGALAHLGGDSTPRTPSRARLTPSGGGVCGCPCA